MTFVKVFYINVKNLFPFNITFHFFTLSFCIMYKKRSTFQIFFLLYTFYQQVEISIGKDGKLDTQKIRFGLHKRESILDTLDLPDVDDKDIHELCEKAKRDLERNSKLKDVHAGVARSYLQRSLKIPREEVLSLSRDANILARSIDLVAKSFNTSHDISERLVKRAAPRPDFNGNILCQQRSFRCNGNSRYRTIDGSCNNLATPDRGMAIVRMERLLAPVYGDGFNSIRNSANGGPLPLSRFVSTTVIPDINQPSNAVTHMIMLFGQFLNHDITSTPHRTDLTDCCNTNNADCMPIEIPNDDEQFAPLGIGCMEFSRSIRACGRGPREQINQNTAFIDGSQIYGSVTNDANRLRANGGFLATSSNNRLPTNPNDQGCASNNRNFPCFVAGDDRVNENPGLISMHTLFTREHNRIVNELRRQNNAISSEVVYQEARRIIIAELQNIVYSEFLPVVLGERMDEFNLKLPDDAFTIYEEDINPNIINSFATAAYRFGHSTIQPRLELGNRQSISLSDNFLNPTVIYQRGITPVIFGATVQNAQRFDNFVTSAVTRELFKQAGNDFGLDLAAINIQRGRDHGLPSYNDFREFCNLPRATRFSDLSNFFVDSRAPGAFQQAYAHINDIDLWPGALAETAVPGGVVGPTFACILGIQFNRLMYGDRFFFNHEKQSGSFTGDQLRNLRQRTLAGIICDNTDMNSLQPKVFQMPSRENSAIDCANHVKLNFRLFRV